MNTQVVEPAARDRASGSPNSAPGPAKAAWLVAEREITTRLRSKAFVISTAILMLVVLAGVVIGGIVSNNSAADAADPDPVPVAVVGAAPEALSGQLFEVQHVDDSAAAERLVQDGTVDAAVVVSGDTPADLTVIALDEVPAEIMQVLSVSPTVELLDDSGGFDFMAYIIAMAFGMVFYTSALTFGTTIAQSVVEEKQTRIVEILLATVPARVLLAGKILGNSILALGTVVLILVLAAVGMLATGQDLLLGELGASLVWFGVLFAFGFVLLATMYAGAASMVSRQEDIGSVTSPVMLLVMAPFFLIIVFFNNPQALGIMSYIPFSAPVSMPLRLYSGTAEWWEPLLSLGIVVVTIVLMVWISSRIYRNSILRIGARVSFKDAVKG